MLCFLYVKVSLVFLCLVFPDVVTSYRTSQNPIKIVIDHDGGADDAMALFIGLLYDKNVPGIELVGLTTVNGNVNENQVFINTQKILNVADRCDVPIYRGAERALVTDHQKDEYFGKDGLGDLHDESFEPIEAQPQHAALALIELSKRYEGDLVVITLGPLTNIALALSLDQDFIGRLKQMYVGAGNVYDKNFTLSTSPEFNALLDVEAYHVLADHAVPDKVTVIPFSEVRKSISISRDWRVNKLGAIHTKIMATLNSYERVNLPKSCFWQLLDPAVIAFALDNSIVHTKLTKNSIILCGGKGEHKRGTTTNDFKSKAPNMRLIDSANEEKYKDFLLKVFSSKQTFSRNS